jgi:hypothetical protein
VQRALALSASASRTPPSLHGVAVRNLNWSVVVSGVRPAIVAPWPYGVLGAGTLTTLIASPPEPWIATGSSDRGEASYAGMGASGSGGLQL